MRLAAGFKPATPATSLPPGWFDKTPNRPYRQQIADMLASIGRAERLFLESASAEIDFFHAWRQTYASCHAEAAGDAVQNPLLTSFGVSLCRTGRDGCLARYAGLSFARAIRRTSTRSAPAKYTKNSPL